MRIAILSIFLLLPTFLPVQAGEALVAVATNFLAPMRTLAAEFEAASGNRLRISSGSTGKLYAQIVNGAPFDLFLAANAREPQRLESEGLIVAGTRFTYARGLLVLASADARLNEGTGIAALRSDDFKRLATANPNTAPYGAAAVAVLKQLDLYGGLRGRLARAENVGQAYQFVATRNAELGFVAKSQVLALPLAGGSWWDVPLDMYPAIDQQAVLLRRGADNVVALAFVAYLQTAAVRDRIAGFGYRDDEVGTVVR